MRRQFQHFEQLFLDQFEQDGDQFVYRKHGRGAPIPVSADEREQFRLQYRRAIRRMIWATTGVVIAAIGLTVWLSPEFFDEGPGIIAISLVAIFAIVILSVRNTAAPERILERRAPVGSPLSKEEWESKHFSTTSWPLLGSIFLISTVVFGRLLWRSEFSGTSDYLWIIGSATFSILGARALWLKYTLSKQRDRNGP